MYQIYKINEVVSSKIIFIIFFCSGRMRHNILFPRKFFFKTEKIKFKQKKCRSKKQ
jgi:hypothetical protein